MTTQASDRREFLKTAGTSVAALGVLSVAGSAALAADKQPVSDLSNGANNFFKSEKVATHKVAFNNQYQMKVVGNLFTPKDLNRSVKHPAIIVGHPMGAVKEQSSNLYAQKLAEQGFVTLAIDQSFWGESEGQTRNLVSPDIYAEAFSAAVDFLGTQSFVNRQRIGVLGICGSGSFVISAAKIDPRMKAIATVSMYDMGAANRNALNHSLTLEQRKQIIADAAQQRYAEFTGGATQYTGGTDLVLNEKTHPIQREFFDFYRTPRGEFTPAGASTETTTRPTLTSNVKFMNFYPFNDIETISPRPMMFITGDQAHSKEFSEEAYRLAGPVWGRSAAQPAKWGGVFAMALCVFALIASEFMPVSLLTPLARDLRISEGQAGLGIAISGAFAVLTSLSMLAMAGNMNRKTLLLGLTALMAVSGAVVALAPNYLIYMVGRALIGVVIGGFWSLTAATAMRLVPPSQVPRALAILNGGNALATVIAAPLGSYLGSVIGWRGAFFCLVPVALIAFIWQGFSLPSMPTQVRPAGSGNVFRLFKHPVLAVGMLAVSTFFMGQFVLFTYLRPFLETVTRVDVATLSLVLLTMGIAGFIGTITIGAVLKWDFYRTLIGIPILMAVIAVALSLFGSQLAVVATLLGIWGLVATAAPVAWWSWLASTLPQDAEAGGGLMVAVIQLAIALGSAIGGRLFDVSGYQSTFVASAVLLLLAAFLTFLTARSPTPRRA